MSENWPSSGFGQPPGRPKQRKGNAVARIGATMTFLIDASTRRRGGRRVWTIFVSVLALVGVLMMSFPFATSLWARRLQSNLRKEVASQEYVDAYKKKVIQPGDALTVLKIPALDINTVVVEGITGNALRAGAGHYPNAEYPGSVLPGDVGNVAIAGHRTGFGEPFRHLDQLSWKRKDQAILTTPVGTYVYEMIPPFDDHPNPWVTGPHDLSVLAASPEPVLTLTTCDPPHTSKNRLIARFKLIRTDPS